MPTLLLEIGTEELPASACREAAEQLPELARKAFDREPDELFIGPRRLALIIRDLPAENTEPLISTGPPTRVAYDEQGAPTKAAEGFARKEGVAVADLLLDEERQVVYVLKRREPLREALPRLVEQVVRGLSFGKSMRWGPDLRFSRPVRWLCVKLDDEDVELEVAGVRSSGRSYGHRLTHGQVAIPTAEAYAETLRAAGVEPSADRRRALIVDALGGLGDWSDPAEVIEEVVYLVESPTVLTGAFDERFRRLPARVIVTAMQSHQRYFPLGDTGFAFVANGGRAELVRAGNERVLEGRLEDATFTFGRDVSKGIDTLAAALGSITFVAGAGSMADKAGRLSVLVAQLGGDEDAREAARLCKADQAAELVREFSDLEGHIGAQYARLAGYSEAVCAAIEEQYLPDSASGPLPESDGGCLLAIAEKIDNLTVAFSLGERPSGTRDRYGLRRAAIGLCRLSIARPVPIDVAALVSTAHRLLVEQGAKVPAGAPDDVHGFVAERLEGVLGLPVEFVRAARGAPLSELGRIAGLASALAALPAERLEVLHTAYTRSQRLAGKSAEDAAPTLDSALLEEEAEQAVATALAQARPAMERAVASGEFEVALGAAAQLGAPLDRFFEDVLVMADEPALRANRLRLLLDVRDTVGLLGDFAQIQR
jgi:glycyl-tRNA synthetase beta chain